MLAAACAGRNWTSSSVTCALPRTTTTFVEPLHPCRFGWFARQGHPLAGRPRVTVDQLAKYPLILSGYADEAVMRRMADLYGFELPLQEHFAASTNDLATVHTLITASDAIAPSTDIAMVSAVRAGTVGRLDVAPALDLELTLGIVERAGRTRVPAAERAFDLVRSYFASVAQEVALHVPPKRRHGGRDPAPDLASPAAILKGRIPQTAALTLWACVSA